MTATAHSVEDEMLPKSTLHADAAQVGELAAAKVTDAAQVRLFPQRISRPNEGRHLALSDVPARMLIIPARLKTDVFGRIRRTLDAQTWHWAAF